MFTILDHLHRGRCVTVVGGPGSGKRSLVVSLANYVAERERFRDGVLWVPAVGMKTTEELHTAVAATAKQDGSKPPEMLLAGMQCLLVLEGCDSLHAACLDKFGDFVERVLNEHGVSIVSTSATPIGILTDVIEKVLPIAKLKPHDQALLFYRRAPRRIRPQEVGCTNQQELLKWLANNEELKQMSPKEVVAAAKQLVNTTVHQVLRAVGEKGNATVVGVAAEDRSNSGALDDDDTIRFFESELPNVGEMVAVEVTQLTELGAFGKLMQYGVTGIILQKEFSRRGLDTSSHFRVGRKEYVRVIKIDTKSKTVDMSKRKVTHDDKDLAKRQYQKSLTVRKIVSVISSTFDMPQWELFTKLVWPLNRSHGHAYDAFRAALSDKSILEDLELPQAVSDSVYELIRDEMSQALSKVAQATRSETLDLSGWGPVSYTHLRAHETPEHLVCRLLLEKKKKK
eukprot:TRINITY_DN14737_c0_g1_i1.p1 TRINITY_DN14737_c0_g1~~TRINITY_DN14737_c0_g1_i1.p1  ORF type:complete len:455 (-),score=122.93 TRINITY_DN14737_c0_g1_i1:97-1461(-)